MSSRPNITVRGLVLTELQVHLMHGREIHLSLRAYEWLVRGVKFHGTSEVYSKGPGHLACPRPWLEHKAEGRGTCCGVEDVRAMYLSHPMRVVYTDYNRDKDGFRAEPITYPNCVVCLMVLDQALSIAPVKTGMFVVPFRRKRGYAGNWGFFKWVRTGSKESSVHPDAWAAVTRTS